MTVGRALVIAVLAFGVVGAGARQKPSATIDLNQPETFPIPPVPPADPMRYQAAPMPNTTLSGPIAAPSRGAQIRPDVLNSRGYNAGQSYIPGSSIERQQEQREKPVPGLNLKMPLP